MLVAGVGHGGEVGVAGIPDVFEDPLGAMPSPMLERIHLPGDEASVVCPTGEVGASLSGPLSLADAIDHALCRNPQIRSAWAVIRTQAAAVGEARAAYLPTLSGSSSWLENRVRYHDSQVPEGRNKGQTMYGALSWRLLDFGARDANRASANRLLEAALSSRDAAVQRMLTQVVQAYFDTVAAEALHEARTESRRIAAETVVVTERKEQRRAASLNDVLQARSALAKAELAERRARGERNKAMAVLVNVLNLPPGSTPVLANGDEPSAPEARESLASWLAETSARHPGIQAARRQLEAARAKVEAVRSEGLPAIDWTTNFYRNGYPNQGLQATKSDTTTWGVTLSIPFFEGFSRTYKIRGAEARVEQSVAELADTERQIMAEVVKAHADAEAALGNLSSSGALLEAAHAAMASSERRYAKGAADVVELLNQQGALAEARQERVRREAEWRSARFRLMASAGVLGRMIAVGLAFEHR
ncbi:MAG: histidine kinase [Rhodocyclales bacterium RIFCSPLOWO2_02_FULL_63_24]|nr:MAG: histidine kinase [Rhodocyclales bacterium RIFCSPLOWO2_02_FULL_63_24]